MVAFDRHINSLSVHIDEIHCICFNFSFLVEDTVASSETYKVFHEAKLWKWVVQSWNLAFDFPEWTIFTIDNVYFTAIISLWCKYHFILPDLYEKKWFFQKFYIF